MATTATTQWILELNDKMSGPMRSINDAMRGAASAFDGLGDKAKKTANDTRTAFDGIGVSGKGAANGIEELNNSTDKTVKSLRQLTATDFWAVGESVRGLSSAFDSAMEPGLAFNGAMTELQALTGLSGQALTDLGEKARQTAIDFNGSASGMVESYKGVLSRLGPDMAKSQEAMDLMGKNIATLSKTMSNDSVGAMDALTTSMLQFGVDLSDPMKAAQEMSRMMNVMAASAKEGASEVPQISAAIKVAGVEAQNQKVSFEETNAALQALAQGGKYGAEAGTALRNVLGKMAGIDVIPKDAADKLFKLGVNYDVVANKSLPFTDRLRELSKAQGDATIMAQMFGTENAAAATILLNSIEYQDQMRQKITDTNSATEQANIIMGSAREQMAHYRAVISDVGVSFFNAAGSVKPFVDAGAGAVTILSQMSGAKQGLSVMFGVLKSFPLVGTAVSGSFGAMSAAANIFKTTLLGVPVVGWIAGITAALVGAGGLYYALRDTTDVQEGFNQAVSDAQRNINDDFDALRRTKEGTIERKNAIEEINKHYGKYLTNLLDEKSTLEDISKAQREANDGLIREIAIKTQKEKITKVAKASDASIDELSTTWIESVARTKGDMSAGLFASELGRIVSALDPNKPFKDQLSSANDFMKAYNMDKNPLFIRDLGEMYNAKVDRDNSLKRINSFYDSYIQSLGGKPSAPTDTAGAGKNKPNSLVIKSGDAATGSESADAGSGSASSSGFSGTGSGGSGSGKSISQKITITNHFNIDSSTDINKIAEQVVRAINDRLRDSIVVVG